VFFRFVFFFFFFKNLKIFLASEIDIYAILDIYSWHLAMQIKEGRFDSMTSTKRNGEQS